MENLRMSLKDILEEKLMQYCQINIFIFHTFDLIELKIKKKIQIYIPKYNINPTMPNSAVTSKKSLCA